MASAPRWALPSALGLLVLAALLVAAAHAGAQQHGGSLLNTGNEITVVEAGADNPMGLAPAVGHVLIRDVLDLQNPSTSPIGYAIVYVPPEFLMYTGYPRVLSYSWDYTVSNYTVVFTDASNGTELAVGGITGAVLALDTGMFRPATEYTWRVVAVEARGFNVTTVAGGSFNSSKIANGTELVIARQGLPVIGPGSETADATRLADLSRGAYLEPSSGLVEGFYRFYLSNMSFEPGVNLTVELRFGSLVGGDGSVELEELLYTERPVTLEVYLPRRMDVRLYSLVGSTETPVSPASSFRDPVNGTWVTMFGTTTSFRLSVRPQEGKGTDWGMVARWAVLIVAIGIIVSVLLYPGSREKVAPKPSEEGAEPEDADGEDAEPEDAEREDAEPGAGEGDGGEDGGVVPEAPAPDDELARLVAERDARVREMREQYAKGERGELPMADVEKLGDRAREDVRRLNRRIKELERRRAR